MFLLLTVSCVFLGRDWCQVSNGGCEFMCLAAPQVGRHPPRYTCVCPDNMTLARDMRRCIPDVSTPVRPGTPAPEPAQPLAPDTTTARPPLRTTTLAPVVVHKPVTSPPAAPPTEAPTKPPPTTTTAVARPAPRTTRPAVRTTRAPTTPPPKAETTTPLPTTAHSSSQAPPTTPDSRHVYGAIPSTASSPPIALYITLPLVIVCMLIVGGFLLWRNYRLKNTNTIHFDNPVYQKTTEDQVRIWRSNSFDAGYTYPKRQIVDLNEEADNPAFTEN